MENRDITVFKADFNNSKRIKYEEEHPIRSAYQRDRDRILYSRAFRRLSGKTQVFLTVKDDHLRTRLTHSLEVSQIARTISKALGLDEDLTEAIALGHDLGHTPFGHVGERTLNHIMNGCYIISDFNTNLREDMKGFKHNWQGVRVATQLEERSLNLTKDVLWGILNHSSLKYKKCKKDSGKVICSLKHNKFKGECSSNYNYSLEFYNDINMQLDESNSWSIEALIVGIADEIAQRHHDIEDAIEYKILDVQDLLDEIKARFVREEDCIFKEEDLAILKDIENNKDNKYASIALFSKLIVNFLTNDIINKTNENLEILKNEYDINSSNDFYNKKPNIFSERNIKELVSFSEKVKNEDEKFQKFLKRRILNSFEAQRMDGAGQYVIRKLFEAYVFNPQQLPDKTIKKLYESLLNNKSELNISKDLIDGMEDKNKIGDIRDIISEIHYDISSENCNIYNSILLMIICDYISGMTDKYALEEHKRLYNCIPIGI